MKEINADVEVWYSIGNSMLITPKTSCLKYTSSGPLRDNSEGEDELELSYTLYWEFGIGQAKTAVVSLSVCSQGLDLWKLA